MQVNTKISRGTPSSKVHVAKTRVSTRYIFSDEFAEKSHHFAKNSVLTIIGLVMLTMILFTLFWLIATPEHLTKRTIEDITSDYYKNYFYDSILDANSITSDNLSEHTEDIERIFGHYEKPGFAKLTLRQLLLYDNQKHIENMSELAKYCNLDNTLIKIYPDPPYNRDNYHVDYTYSCKF